MLIAIALVSVYSLDLYVKKIVKVAMILENDIDLICSGLLIIINIF